MKTKVIKLTYGYWTEDTTTEDGTIKQIETNETFHNETYTIGDEVLLVEVYNTSTGTSYYEIWKKYAKTGYPGNADKDIKLYHGWRGETNGLSKFAKGTRKILKIEKDKKYSEEEKIYRVTLSDDLHPELD